MIRKLLDMFKSLYEPHDGERDYVKAVTDNLQHDYSVLREAARVVRDKSKPRLMKLREQSRRDKLKSTALDELISATRYRNVDE